MTDMEQFWDARAREDAFYFVDSRLRYSAPDEASFWTGGERALANLLAALDAEIPPGATVLDIGCGLGRLTRPLARTAAQVYALDVSREMLDRARQLNPQLDNVRWLHGDGTSLRPVEDAAVDVCLSHVVFRHIPDPAITLGYVREMGRVLRPNGLAVFELSNDPRPHTPGRVSRREKLAARLGRRPRGQDDAPWLGSSVDLRDLARTAQAADLVVERVEGRGTEFCAVRLRRTPAMAGQASPGSP
jgi:SAM-dependent methyltransferase